MRFFATLSQIARGFEHIQTFIKVGDDLRKNEVKHSTSTETKLHWNHCLFISASVFTVQRKAALSHLFLIVSQQNLCSCACQTYSLDVYRLCYDRPTL